MANRVLGPVLEEEADQGAEGIEEEADYEQVDDQEYRCPAPHREAILGSFVRRKVRRMFSEFGEVVVAAGRDPRWRL